MDLALLAHACAPYVAVQTTRAIVDVESGRDALAIHVNGARLQRPARSLGEAIATARALRAQGWNLDLGLAQINVRNLDRLGVPIEQAFDPCLPDTKKPKNQGSVRHGFIPRRFQPPAERAGGPSRELGR